MRASTSLANRTAYVKPAREQSEKSIGTRIVRISRCCAQAREILEVFISSFHRSSCVDCVNFRLRNAFDVNHQLALTARKLRNSTDWGSGELLHPAWIQRAGALRPVQRWQATFGNYGAIGGARSDARRGITSLRVRLDQCLAHLFPAF